MPAVSNSDVSAPVTFKCRKGDSFLRTLTFQTNGVNDNLSGHTFRMMVRGTVEPFTLVLSFTMGNGASIVSNQLRLSKTALEMDAVAGGVYKYDLEQIFPDGTVRTRLRGSFIINADVSYS